MYEISKTILKEKGLTCSTEIGKTTPRGERTIMTDSTKDKDSSKVMVGDQGANITAIQTGSTVGIPSKERADLRTDSTKDHKVHKILQTTDKGVLETKASHKAISEARIGKTKADKALEERIPENKMKIYQIKTPPHVNIAGNIFTEPEAGTVYFKV